MDLSVLFMLFIYTFCCIYLLWHFQIIKTCQNNFWKHWTQKLIFRPSNKKNMAIFLIQKFKNLIFEWNFGVIRFWVFRDLKRSFRGQWGHLTTKSMSCHNFSQNHVRNMKIKFLDLQENKFGEKSQFYVKISTNIITLWSYGALTNLLWQIEALNSI